MFARSYFGARYFAPVYWPPVAAGPPPVFVNMSPDWIEPTRPTLWTEPAR